MAAVPHGDAEPQKLLLYHDKTLIMYHVLMSDDYEINFTKL